MDLSWVNGARAVEAELSREAKEGVHVAAELLRHQPSDRAKTVVSIAQQRGVHVSTLYRWISKAHAEWERERRPCRYSWCNGQLPLGARASRAYCDVHATAIARVHRHRDARDAAARLLPSSPRASTEPGR
jgi:hypothetical protein